MTYPSFKISHSRDFGTPTTLVNQAGPTAAQYFSEAVNKIDDVFGDGYAREHPELVAKFMEVAAIDFATAMVVRAIMYHGEQVAEGQKE